MVVLHLVSAQFELLRADEGDVLDEQAFGHRKPWVDGLLRHWVTDVFRFDREGGPGADARKTALAVHFISDVVRTMQFLEGLAEDRPRTGGAALNERLKSLALRGVRPIVDERGRHAVPFVDRGRPVRV
jgi:hypothetical protein